MPANPRRDPMTSSHVNASKSSNGQPAMPDERTANRAKPERVNPDNGHGHDDEHVIPDDLPKVSGGAAVMIGVVLLALFGGLFLLGWIPHRHRQAEAAADAREAVETKPIVDLVTPKRSDPTVDLMLPADVQAYQQTSLFARTNGYLKPLPPGIDIGAEVKAGQLLAEISAPEVDAQLEEAKASLLQASVTVERAGKENAFATGTYDRYKGLAKTGGVTGQQLEEKRVAYSISESSLKAAKANVAVADAAVKRLTETQAFQKIVAPFDGVITARNFDSGALISATGAREMFRLAENDKLRVFVNVPQTYATDVRNGQEAELYVRNSPGKAFKGVVARSSEAIDPNTRTMRTEVDIPNEDRALKPGMWGQVRFKIHQTQPPVVVPTSALVFGADGMKVATIEAGDKVKFKKVVVGRDFGSEAEVASGLDGTERVVSNPGDRLADGVEVALHKKAAGQQAEAAPSAPPTTKPAAAPSANPAAGAGKA